MLRLLPPDAVSDKEITVGGRKIAYTATAGTLVAVRSERRKSAAVFYTAYIAKDAPTPREAPITFAFNGGPGAASAYLNLGLAGPRIVDFGPDGRDGAAAKLVDNPDSWLAFTDLVMIDPIGTGWSRTAKPDDGKAFWGVRSDANVMAKVIALYVAKNSRAASPKYLLGESYGGFRAAKVARRVAERPGHRRHRHRHGVAAARSVVPMGRLAIRARRRAAFPDAGRDRARADQEIHARGAGRSRTLRHDRLSDDARGPPPTGDKAKAFYGRIAELTGLPVDVVTKARGWVRNAYLQHLRANGKTVSSYDATFAVPDPYPESAGGAAAIRSSTASPGRLSGAFVGYARDELGFKTDMTYTLLAHDVSSKWEWGDRREPPGVSDDLRELLAFSPSFRLLVAHGRTDLVSSTRFGPLPPPSPGGVSGRAVVTSDIIAGFGSYMIGT